MQRRRSLGGRRRSSGVGVLPSDESLEEENEYAKSEQEVAR